MTRIVSWNILQGGGRRVEGTCAALKGWSPDIVTLQEFRHGTAGDTILGTLKDMGLRHSYVASDDGSNTLMIASKTPLDAGPFMAENSERERLLEAQTKDLTLLPLHFPQKAAQIPLFKALIEDGPSLLGLDALLIGDLNCGIPFADSDSKTFQNTGYFQQMLTQGWVDIFRHLHDDAQEFTWVSPRTGHRFRYDHALASPSLIKRVKAFDYDHTPREAGISDHSAMIMDLG